MQCRLAACRTHQQHPYAALLQADTAQTPAAVTFAPFPPSDTTRRTPLHAGCAECSRQGCAMPSPCCLVQLDSCQAAPRAIAERQPPSGSHLTPSMRFACTATAGPCKDPEPLPQSLPTLPFSLTGSPPNAGGVHTHTHIHTQTGSGAFDTLPPFPAAPEVTRADRLYTPPKPQRTAPSRAGAADKQLLLTHNTTHTRPCVDTQTRLPGPHYKSSVHPARQLAHSSCCPFATNATVVIADTDTRKP